MTTTTSAPAAALNAPGSDRMTRAETAGLVVLCFTLLLISIDQTVLNVALPTLVKQLHPTSSGLQWIADSYILTNAVFLLLGGALGDRFGRRKMFMIGTGIFGLGSLICSLVHSTDPLIGARAFTGFGAALLMPATLSIVVSMFEGHKRARAIGIWAGVGGIGSAAGPLLGGYLLQHYWWGSVFLINVPIAVIAVLGGMWLLPESRSETKVALDPMGVVLSAAGFAGITYAVIVAPTKHWGSPTIITTVAGSVVILAFFLFWDGRREHPLFDIALFRNRTFSSGIAAITALFFAMFGVSFLISQYIQFVKRYDVFGVGIRFLPLAVGSLVGSNIAARLTRRFGLRRILMTGMAMLAVGLAIFIGVSVTSPYLLVGIAFGLLGLGSGIAIAPASNAVVSTLAPDKVGAGSGLRATVQLLGGSFGVAIVGSIATGQYRSHVDAAYAHQLRAVPLADRPAISEQLGQAISAAAKLPTHLGNQVTAVASRAFVDGMHVSAIVGVVVLVVASIGAAMFIPANIELSDDSDEHSVMHG